MPDEPPLTTLSLERYAPEAKALVAGAQALADERKHAEVQPLHFLGARAGARSQVLEACSSARRPTSWISRPPPSARSATLPQTNEPAYLVRRDDRSARAGRARGGARALAHGAGRTSAQRAFAGDPRPGGRAARRVRRRAGLAARPRRSCCAKTPRAAARTEQRSGSDRAVHARPGRRCAPQAASTR